MAPNPQKCKCYRHYNSLSWTDKPGLSIVIEASPANDYLIKVDCLYNNPNHYKWSAFYTGELIAEAIVYGAYADGILETAKICAYNAYFDHHMEEMERGELTNISAVSSGPEYALVISGKLKNEPDSYQLSAIRKVHQYWHAKSFRVWLIKTLLKALPAI